MTGEHSSMLEGRESVFCREIVGLRKELVSMLSLIPSGSSCVLVWLALSNRSSQSFMDSGTRFELVCFCDLTIDDKVSLSIEAF